MTAHRFKLVLDDGTYVTGPVHGCGGVLDASSGPRLDTAIARARKGLPTNLYEPKPGHARVYPNYSADGNGEPLDVDLRRAQRVVATFEDGRPAILGGRRKRSTR